MPPQLILNADDFGLTPGINRAVIKLHHAGVLTSATLMATGPAFDHAAALARAHPTLGVGCHLVFTDGLPVSHPDSIPTLLGNDGKHFRRSLYDFAQALLRNTIREEDLAREAQAQIQKLQRAGLDVTHVDTHKHTHLFPAVLAPVLHIAQSCAVHALRNPFEPAWSSQLTRARLGRRTQVALLRRFEPAFRKQLAQASALAPAGTLGIAATGALTGPTLHMLLSGLSKLPDQDPSQTFELCCHPGHRDPALDASTTRLRTSREIEYRALLEVIPQLLAQPGAPRLIHFGQLGIPACNEPPATLPRTPATRRSADLSGPHLRP